MNKAHIVVGLGYGDEGKGAWVDHLVRKHELEFVVRFNGGSQAAHHVVTPQGQMHCFAQFGAGSFVPDTATILSRFMLVEPEAWLAEAGALLKLGVNPQVLVSEAAPIITPFNRLLNRIQETARGKARHGSCGSGIGVTQADVETLGEAALYARDLRNPVALLEKLERLHKLKVAAAEQVATPDCVALMNTLRTVDLAHYVELFGYFARRVEIIPETKVFELLRYNSTVFEGAQGVLLDQHYGFFPHCTRSTTSFENALQLLREAEFEGEVERIGLLRGYATRHGAGPLVTADANLQVPACHNRTNEWQGQFRVGWFDAVAARYALEAVKGVDTLAITNLDRLVALPQLKVATRYQGEDTRFLSEDGRRLTLLDPKDFALRTEMTKSLATMTPQYTENAAWQTATPSGVEEYLRGLEELLAHPINAYSTSIDHQKLYR